MPNNIRFVDDIRGVFIADPSGNSQTRAILELADGAYEFILIPACNASPIPVVVSREVHVPAPQPPQNPDIPIRLVSLCALLAVAITTVNGVVIASILIAIS